MKRNIDGLSQTPFDIVVVGGGIYGAWAAYDAVLRGMSVAIVDKGDWASGTSSASTKLIHGGLRYLEQCRLGMVRRSLRERELLLKLAPHRVTPLRFIIPDYADNRVGRLKLRAGLMLYDVLAGGGTGSRGIGRDEMVTDHAFLARDGLRGGLAYADCQMDDARFVLEIIDGASSAGAVAANYVEAIEVLRANGKVHGVMARDRISGREIEIKAGAVVNTAGPWAARLDGPPQRLVKGVHLVMPALPSGDAYLFMARQDARVFFMVPWYGRTLLGTTDSDFDGDVDNVRVDRSDIAYLLGEAARYIGEGGWGEADILGRFAGVRALQDVDADTPATATREWKLTDAADGLFVSLGGKYTSARADAEQLVDHVVKYLKHDVAASSTSLRPFPWCPPDRYDKWLHEMVDAGRGFGLSPESSAAIAQRHGSHTTRIHDTLASSPQLAATIEIDLPFIRAELISAVTDEMAMTLEDVVRRRVPLAVLCELTEPMLQSIVALIAPHLQPSADKLREQIEPVLDRWARAIIV